MWTTRFLVLVSVLGSCSRGPAVPAPPDVPDALVGPRLPDARPAPATTEAGVVGDPCASLEPSPTCLHPAVTPSCKDGWCLIPAGCFIMGSPPCEWARGRNSETESETTLTHAFYMQEKELTIGEWVATGEPNVSLLRDAGIVQCTEPSCPVAQVNWYEALRFANAFSKARGLPECYRVEGCETDAGTGPVGPSCATAATVNASVYECDGYRLPTEAEWEYAARAGTRTATSAGALTPTAPPASPTDCSAQPVLDGIAWYCANSDGRTHPGGQKAPNPWGLFDMGGNAAEHTSERYTGIGYVPARRTDPGATLVAGPDTPLRGGSALDSPRLLRSAGHLGLTRFEARGGLRLVRTAK